MRMTERRGSLLVDALLAVVIFGAVVAAFSSGIFQGQQGTIRGGNRIRAAYLAQEALEAVRVVRDRDGFSAVSSRALDQDDGVQLSGASWGIVDSPTTVDGIYTRAIRFAAGASARERNVRATVTWPEAGSVTPSSLTVSSYLSNWRTPPPPPCPDWSAATVVGKYRDRLNTSFVDIAIDGNYAYVSSQDGGDGFLVFDISGTTPLLVANSNSVFVNTYLGMHDVVKTGYYAYIGRTPGASEMVTINVTTPTNYSQQSSQDPAGVAAAQGLAIQGNTLYMVRGADGSVGANEYIEYDIAGGNAANPQEAASRSLNMDDRLSNAIALSAANYAYLGTDHSSQDLTAINANTTPPTNPGGGDPPGIGNQGLAVAYNQGYVFAGMSGDYPYELYSYNVSSAPGNPGAPASQYSTGDSGSSGEVYDIAISPRTDCNPIALIATDAQSGGGTLWDYFQAVDISNGSDIQTKRIIALNVRPDLIPPDPPANLFGGKGIAVRASDNRVFLVGGADAIGSVEGFILVIDPGPGSY